MKYELSYEQLERLRSDLENEMYDGPEWSSCEAEAWFDVEGGCCLYVKVWADCQYRWVEDFDCSYAVVNFARPDDYEAKWYDENDEIIGDVEVTNIKELACRDWRL